MNALTDGSELGVLLGDLEHVEERDKGLIAGLGKEELKGIAVECNALKRVKDRVQKSATRY